LIYARDPATIHKPIVEASQFNFSMSPDWCQIVEFYCPECGIMLDNEYLPPGHPITHDIELDIKKLKAKYLKE
jgi:acetophenone carboxylase